MRVLITGGAGFVGSHIVDELLAAGASVLVVDDLSTGKQSNLSTDAELVELDMGSPAFHDVVRRFKPDVVSHCAAQASVSGSMKDPQHDANVNILGGINVAQAAIEQGCDQFIYINTGGALYGDPDYLPCDEDHPIRPMSGYGLSKWTMECYLRILLPESMPLKVLRLANVYGPRQDPYGEAGVISIFAERMLKNEPAYIFGDGEQTRDFVYVGDVARAHRQALEHDDVVTVNIGSGKQLSVNQLFRQMAETTGYTQPPVYMDERPGDIKHSVLAVARAREQLGWESQVELADGLRITIDALREANG